MAEILPMPPTKILAVHVNYRSRAEERGRTPNNPSYFLKPPSSLSMNGADVVRPQGCQLLAFEGEIALVVGKRAFGLTRDAAWDHIDWVTAANDLGVYDLKHADGGSNLRSKGIDGFTPVGPRLLDARGIEASELRLRTWVNGDIAQDTAGDEVLFGFDQIIADITRLTTLEPGDIILTGTPTGSTVIEPGDVVEVEVTAGERSTGRLSNRVVDAPRALPPWGAMPSVDEATRAAAYGTSARTSGIGAEVWEALRTVSTATLSVQLRMRGLEHAVLEGLRSCGPGEHMVGLARTVRYLPLREDLAESRRTQTNVQKSTIDQLKSGEVLVIDARGELGAGTIGDILALRARARGAAGVVTDGAIRDAEAIADIGLPVYHAATHPSVLGRHHIPWESDVPVSCAGVLVQPGDVLVGDGDGVVVVPPDIAADIVDDAVEQERQERFIAERVAAGEAVHGLYPLGTEWRAAYEEWCSRGEGSAAAS